VRLDRGWDFEFIDGALDGSRWYSMKKIGRNDPCPCGSGKKFKKCHLGREDELFLDKMGEFTEEQSRQITGLPETSHGRAKEILEGLDIKALTGRPEGIKFIDLRMYHDLGIFGQRAPEGDEKKREGGVVVNIYKTSKSDPDNIYIAISPGITDSALIHEVAHVLDYLGGSGIMPGILKPLSFELGIPVEHVEHPMEYGYWLDYLRKKFDVQLDADDTIISYLYQHKMLIPGEIIQRQDRQLIKKKSESILAFLSEKSAEIDTLICELPGYIGCRVGKDH